ncbi:MAG TPA: sulfite exporter TauE/SafE family protein [Gammaproteobacteria bacterium]
MIETVLLFAAAGLAAGFLAGLLGIGGGLVVVPLLYFHFSADPVAAPYAMHLALGSSLAFIVINSGAAAWTHMKLDGVHWREVRLLAPGLAIGSIAGAALADQLPTPVLARFFGVFMLAMAALMFFRTPRNFHPGNHWHSAIIGLPVGIVAALAGVGGGVMVVPWLFSRGYRAAHVIATTSVCTVVVALVGTLGYTLFAEPVPLPGAFGYVHWPAVFGIAVTAFFMAQVGARLAHRVDQKMLRKGFAALLVVVGLRLLLA